MNALIINITTPNDSAANRDFTIFVLKDAAYNSKYKNVANKSMEYDHVFVPIIQVDQATKNTARYKEDLKRYLELLPQTTGYSTSIGRDGYYSLGKFLEKNIKGVTTLEKLLRYNFYIDVVNEITYSQYGISYTDGSSNASDGSGGYCCISLKNQQCNLEEAYLLDNLTGSNKNYDIHAGRLEIATNNSSELTAIKEAIINAGSELYQVIISDSDYSMKSFREYIQNWRVNGWRAANKQPIKNLELMQEIDSLLRNSNKIFLFQWTESHTRANPFNEMCDAIAKSYSGVN